jgi:homoserine dehydrogenase
MKNTTLHIGFFGFGVVGQGLYDVLTKSRLQDVHIHKICIKDISKKRTLPSEMFTTDALEVLDNPQITTIVEMINDPEQALWIAKEVMSRGKNYISASKKMLAPHLGELLALQKKYNVSLLYEASSCGSIPIIRNLEEYYDNEFLHAVYGIFNGTSNYILSQIFSKNQTYEQALREAQELGFAETDPTDDVEGFDAKYKLCIISNHAFGIVLNPDDVLNVGISQISEHDIRFAKEKDVKIKLIAEARKIGENEVFTIVSPHFIWKKHPLYHVENEFNGVIIEGAFSQKQTLLGKGAGGYPTGSAILSDISALRYDYQYEHRKMSSGALVPVSDVLIEVYFRYHTEEQAKMLNFESISERYESAKFCYLIGNVKLSEIKQKHLQLAEKGLTIIRTGKLNEIRQSEAHS